MKQISIFIENVKGKLAAVTNLLAENNVDLRALSIADSTDYGILRIVADDAEKAKKVLDENSYLAKVTDVLAVKTEDKPGSLAKIITALASADISVEYAYAFTSSEPGIPCRQQRKSGQSACQGGNRRSDLKEARTSPIR